MIKTQFEDALQTRSQIGKGSYFSSSLVSGVSLFRKLLRKSSLQMIKRFFFDGLRFWNSHCSFKLYYLLNPQFVF
jgi:hypothetical protein